jgi:hypothetical protein
MFSGSINVGNFMISLSTTCTLHLSSLLILLFVLLLLKIVILHPSQTQI